jgi:type II secretory pathway pseudopilin PulG
LIEVLVVTAVLGLVVSYVMETLSDQRRTHAVVEQVTETQQNLRLIADLVEREIRLAGYMVPPSAAACGRDASDAPDTFYVSAADAIRTIQDLESIDPALVQGGLGVPVGAFPLGAISSTNDVLVPLTRRYVDVAADGDDFSAGAGLILVDRNDAEGVVACGRIIAPIPSGSTPQLTVDFEVNNLSVASGADLVAIPAHVYRVVAVSPNSPSQLFRDNALLASDVEDLQIVYYFDDDDDRVVDAGELYGDAGGPTYPPSSATRYHQLIDIRLNVVLTTRDDDPDRDFTLMKGQPTANRTLESVPGPDRRRRRVHQSLIRLRNLG